MRAVVMFCIAFLTVAEAFAQADRSATLTVTVLDESRAVIPSAQVTVLLAVALVTMAIVAFAARPLLFASVDPDVAAARGVPTRWLPLLHSVCQRHRVARRARPSALND